MSDAEAGRVGITAVGAYLPSRAVSSAQVQERVARASGVTLAPDLAQLIGIRTRRAPGTRPVSGGSARG